MSANGICSDNMPMNLKDEIVAGESYSLEFKRVPNEEREKSLKAVVAFANGKDGTRGVWEVL